MRCVGCGEECGGVWGVWEVCEGGMGEGGGMCGIYWRCVGCGVGVWGMFLGIVSKELGSRLILGVMGVRCGE